MNKPLARAAFAREQAQEAYNEASLRLTAAINDSRYSVPHLRGAHDDALYQARDDFHAASDWLDVAKWDERQAGDVPLWELRVRDGWTLVPSFKSYWYDELDDAADTLDEALTEMHTLMQAGKISGAASITLVSPEGTRGTWTKQGYQGLT